MKSIHTKTGEVITLRTAEVKDAAKLIEYVQQVCTETDYLTFGEGEFNITVEAEEKMLESAQDSKNTVFFIAEHNKKIIAFLNCNAGQRPRVAHDGTIGITVLKDYWGHGVGRALMVQLIHWAKNQATLKKLNLRVRTDNHRAISLYLSLGFEVEGKIRGDLYVQGKYYDSYHMGMWLH